LTRKELFFALNGRAPFITVKKVAKNIQQIVTHLLGF
jgi:hypothetical protein